MFCRFCCLILVFIVVCVNGFLVPQADSDESCRGCVVRNKRAPLNHTMALQRLTALRSLMSRYSTPLTAVIIPTSDAHDSEYIAPVDARREWISGFTGSAGTAIVTSSHALVWTDGRYYTQFEKETDSALWTLMKESLPETPSMESWLTSNLEEGAVVGADPYLTTRKDWTKIQTALQKSNMQLIPVEKNLVDEARTQLNHPPPVRPCNEVIPLSIEYTGKAAGQKISELRQKMAEKKVEALVITALDEVAYTLNLRGSDIEYNPVFFSYLLITTSSVDLFWNDANLSATVVRQLEEEGVQNFTVKPYGAVVQCLEALASELSQSGDGRKSVWLSDNASEAIHRAAAGGEKLSKPLNLVSEVSPVAIAKLVKNDVELQGFRECHIRDGIAVVRFFRWLEEKVNSGASITEIDASDKLLQFRQEEEDFIGPSFETIAGAGENGAIIHYSPYTEQSKRVIRQGEVFLLDSGGQYRCGTTDITRTRFMGETAFDELKDRFTRVLIGQMTVGMAVFPRGVKGNVLDSFARKSLWDVGLDYAHGTGHGVGHFLNVHEGPSGVSWRPYPNDPGLAPGQILSNEPGFYKVGEYGIRHEDLVEIIALTKNSTHPKSSSLVGDYDGRGVLGFNTLTMVPHQRACVDVNMLSEIHLSYLNEYHKRVVDTLGPILSSRGLHQDAQWLQRECAPLVRTVWQ